MEFQRKRFESVNAVIVSEKPLYGSKLEERISYLIPALEYRIDSFDTYVDAYNHVSGNRNTGIVILHKTAKCSLPLNIVDELSAPYESVGARTGLIVIAEDEHIFTECYKSFGVTPRLISILLESELADDSFLKENIISSWDAYESFQRNLALPAEELDFVARLARRFEDVGALSRVTKILTNKLEKSWYDSLLIEAAPTLLSIPVGQRWILENSESLMAVIKTISSTSNRSMDELVTLKDNEFVIRAVDLAHRLYYEAKKGTLEDTLNRLTDKTTAFAPTLKKILNQEKLNIREILEESVRTGNANGVKAA